MWDDETDEGITVWQALLVGLVLGGILVGLRHLAFIQTGL